MTPGKQGEPGPLQPGPHNLVPEVCFALVKQCPTQSLRPAQDLSGMTYIVSTAWFPRPGLYSSAFGLHSSKVCFARNIQRQTLGL